MRLRTKLMLFTALPFFASWLAESDTLYCFVKEGTVKAIMTGQGFDRFEMSLHGHHLNEPGRPDYDKDIPKWEVLENPNGAPDDIYDRRTDFQKDVGVYMVGIPPFANVYSYQFEWAELKMNQQSKKDEIWPRDEMTDFAFVVDFPYAILVDSERTSDGVLVDALYLMTIRINNPYKALFDTEDWLRRVSAVANRIARNYIGMSLYADLSSESDKSANPRKDKESENFSRPIISLTGLLPDEDPNTRQKYKTGTAGNYGVTIRAAEPKWFRVSDGTAEAETSSAIVKVFIARQNAEATRLQADADAYAIQVKGEKQALADAARLDVIKRYGSIGALMAQLDALTSASQGAGNTVVWANNPFVKAVSGLASVLEEAGITSLDQLRDYLNDKQQPAEETSKPGAES